MTHLEISEAFRGKKRLPMLKFGLESGYLRTLRRHAQLLYDDVVRAVTVESLVYDERIESRWSPTDVVGKIEDEEFLPPDDYTKKVKERILSGTNVFGICGSCQGKGDLPCTHCEGIGHKKCMKCFGRGYIKTREYFRTTGDIDSEKRIFRPCLNCNGKGYEKCTFCDAGRKKCSGCNGSGQAYEYKVKIREFLPFLNKRYRFYNPATASSITPQFLDAIPKEYWKKMKTTSSTGTGVQSFNPEEADHLEQELLADHSQRGKIIRHRTRFNFLPVRAYQAQYKTHLVKINVADSGPRKLYEIDPLLLSKRWQESQIFLKIGGLFLLIGALLFSASYPALLGLALIGLLLLLKIPGGFIDFEIYDQLSYHMILEPDKDQRYIIEEKK